MRDSLRFATCLLIALTISGIASAATLDDALNEMKDGRLRFDYPVREGVYGDGRSVFTDWHDQDDDWVSDCDCSQGPARVSLRVRAGEVIDVDVRVGGSWRRSNSSVRDLGAVSASEASTFLLGIAESATGGDVSETIFAASIAEGFDRWDCLVAIARDDDRPRDLRHDAIFWLGQAAGHEAGRQLIALVDDDDEELSIREQAIFALSQRSADECIEPLRRVATQSRHKQLRETAFFWLAQHDDPRVIDLFEEVLLER